MLLGENIHSEAQAKKIVEECGLSLATISFSGTPRDWWYGVLRAAHQARRLDALLEELRRELPCYADQIVDPFARPPRRHEPAPCGHPAPPPAAAAAGWHGAGGFYHSPPPPPASPRPTEGRGRRVAAGEGQLAWHAPAVPSARRPLIAAGAVAALALAGIVTLPTLVGRLRADDGGRAMRAAGHTAGAAAPAPPVVNDHVPDAPRGFLSRPEDCGRLVINEVKPGGRTAALDEFVELFNPGTCPVVLDNWSLRYLSAAGLGGFHYWKPSSAGLRVAPGKYFVVAGKDYSGDVKDDAVVSNRGMAEHGGLALFLHDAPVDAVAWGAVPAGHAHAESKAAASPRKGRSLARAADGIDTDCNAADFGPAMPTPGARNRARP